MGGSRGLSYFQQDIPLAPTCLRSNSDWRVLRLALVERKVLARYNSRASVPTRTIGSSGQTSPFCTEFAMPR
jgi:hypothetical protein